MRTRVIQSNLTRGELSPDLHSRVDNEIYFSGLSKAQNVVIMPHGGVRRRPGLTKTVDSKLSERGKLFSFEFSTDQDYLIILIPNKFRMYRDGELVKEISSKFTTWEQIEEVDGVQSGDVMILTHGDVYPQMLRREGDDTTWAVIDAPLSNIPQYDFGGGTEENVWSAERGWPYTCTFFQARLYFGGSPQKPNSVWGSKINSYYDFDVGTGQADYGIFDTLDTDQFNKITNIFPGRNLQVFTTGSEFYNVAEYITPELSVWKRSTGYGSARIRPVMVDGATLFIDRVKRTIRSSVYEFTEDAFISPSISVLSEHLLTKVDSMAAVKGTNIDISDFIYVINQDGTCAVLNTLRHQKTEGWTQWTTQGSFRDVCEVNKIVYFLVERQGEFHIEYINEGTTLDHNTIELGTKRTQYNVVMFGENVIHDGNNVIYTDNDTGTPVTVVNTGESPAIAALDHKVLLDHSVMADSLGGVIVLERPAYRAEVGLDVELVVRTMPLNQEMKDGQSFHKEKRIVRVELYLRDSLGVYAFKTYSPDRKFTVVFDEAPEPYTGRKEIRLLGYNHVTIIEIMQENPLPFKMLSLGYEINQ